MSTTAYVPHHGSHGWSTWQKKLRLSPIKHAQWMHCYSHICLRGGRTLAARGRKASATTANVSVPWRQGGSGETAISSIGRSNTGAVHSNKSRPATNKISAHVHRRGWCRVFTLHVLADKSSSSADAGPTCTSPRRLRKAAAEHCMRRAEYQTGRSAMVWSRDWKLLPPLAPDVHTAAHSEFQTSLYHHG